ncbi:dynamin family protein [Komagataeibacter kakiaceti JCM 25156]|uniref:dynamin family protein n=1 Tax=Komagataeibacter kakiaceti TaxID=943261 RepID=UPI0004724ED4|nr:dynamin family protein [Komagataeibacter kakiaceti]
MKAQDIVALNSRLAEITDLYAPELGKDLAYLRHQHAISSSDELTASFSALDKAERLLQVGVVGRVKAGKSSLLNALIFDGHNILPKAVTPMTAALTTLAYGETFGAQVQFYSADDLKNIRNNAEIYNKRLEKEYQRLTDEARAKRLRQGKTAEDDGQFLAMVKKQAVRAMSKEFALAAAHDQWQRIRQSGIDPDTLDACAQLHAEDAQSLAGQLLDFVGAEGRYMPLTKSVDIFLPLNSLRHIRIIDTPGFNDPIQSREERTVQLLKDCDVVLIVSPAGQFLSEQDMELMSRITQKEGIQELFVVASQIDNQLYGSDTLQPTLRAALAGITNKLGTHMVSTLQRLKSQHPEIGTTFDTLIQAGTDNILYASGICQSLLSRFEQQAEWDSGEHKAWDNLQKNYPDFFVANDPVLCRESLSLLANTASIQEVLERVRKHKDRILEERRTELLRSKEAALEAFRADLINFAKDRGEQLRHTNVSALKLQRQELNSLMVVATHDLDIMLQEQLHHFRELLNNSLKNRIKNAYSETQNEFKDATKETTEQRSRVKNGLWSRIAHWAWGGGMEDYTHHEFVLYPTPVRAGLQNFIEELGRILTETSSTQISDFRKKLVQEVTVTARRHIPDELNAALIIRAINGLVSAIQLPEFKLDTTELNGLSGSNASLKGDEARQFLEKAENLLSCLRARARDQIGQFLTNLATDLPSSFPRELFADLQNRIEQLEQEANNLALSLDRLQLLSQKLEAA